MKNIKRLTITSLLAIFALLALLSAAIFNNVNASAETDETTISSADDFKSEFHTATDGDYFKLTADITLDADYTYTLVNIGNGNEITLDLNGHNLTLTEANLYGFYVYSGTLNIAGSGSVSSYCSAFMVDGSGILNLGDGTNAVSVTTAGSDDCTAYVNGGTMNVNSNASVTNTGYTISVWYSGTLNVYGNVSSTGSFAIVTNGADDTAHTINVYSGAQISSETDTAIYHTSGTLNLLGGSISGQTGIFIRGGALNVTGDVTISATGDNRENNPSITGGAINTGDALIIVNGGASYPALSVSIQNGTFTSAKGSAVVSTYSDPETTIITGFISGGKFSTDIRAYVASGHLTLPLGNWWRVL